MVRLLSIGIDAISTILVLLPIMIILRYTVFKRYTKISFLLVLIYAIYLSAVFSVVGIPALNSIIVNGEFNLIPLVDIPNRPREYVINTVGSFTTIFAERGKIKGNNILLYLEGDTWYNFSVLRATN